MFGIVIVFVGNKFDFINDSVGGDGEGVGVGDGEDVRKVMIEEVKLYVEEEGFFFFEISVKMGYNVIEVFMVIVNVIFEILFKMVWGFGVFFVVVCMEE